jgi:hypothetical protein
MPRPELSPEEIEKIKKEVEEELAQEEKYEELSQQIRIKGLKREEKRKKEKNKPKGGTLAGQFKKMKTARFYRGSRPTPKITIKDKSKK